MLYTGVYPEVSYDQTRANQGSMIKTIQLLYMHTDVSAIQLSC